MQGMQSEITPVDHVRNDLMEYFEKSMTNFTGLEPEHKFTLPHDAFLGQTNHALVWKGMSLI